MYLATLSDLANEPVLIWDELVATARSAMKVSSESPDLCEIMVLKLFFWAKSITFKVSVKVPIWFSFIKIEFADFASIPFLSLFSLVTNRSSPTICTFFPISEVIFLHAFQSS